MTAARRTPTTAPRATLRMDEGYALAVTAYERTTGWIVSLLVLLGTIAFCLAVLWASSQLIPKVEALPVLVESIGGRGEAPAGLARDLEAPGLEELPDYREPSLQETLTVLDVAAQAAALMETQFDDPTPTPGSGLGDSRRAGPAGEGDGSGIPRHERWEIRFKSGLTLIEYARRLDFFQIELAAIGGGERDVIYASSLADKAPAVRRGKPTEEKRLRMNWRRGELMQADRQLLAAAGVDLQGKQVVQFFSPETENQLAWIEKEYAGDHEISTIRRTIFGVRVARNQFEFYVQAQYYL